MSTETTCRCGKPTRDDAYFCDDCGEQLSIALGEMSWLEDELDTTIGKRKGVDYRRVGGGKGGSTSHPSPPEWTASEARAHLKGVLVAWVKFCMDEHVRNSSPHLGIPADNLTAISRWLLWRVDGLSLSELGPDAVDEITSAVAHCRRLIDKPAERQYLGECKFCEGGRLYAQAGSRWAMCNLCKVGVEAETLKMNLLRELDDRLCTAAEVAELSTYLGLPDDRERVRKRIERWGASDRHTLVRIKVNGQDHYRFGAAYLALMSNENKRGAKAS